MTSNNTITPDEAAHLLETALAALGLEVAHTTELGAAARAGAAAGAIMATILDLLVAAAVDGDGPADPAGHRALVYALDRTADTLRADQLYTYLNLLQLWAMGSAMQGDVGSDQAVSAAMHIEAAKEHIEGSKESHDIAAAIADEDDDEVTVEFIGPFYNGDPRGAIASDLMNEFKPPAADPVERVSRSCMALGLLPGMAPVDEESGELMHAGYLVATLAGTLAARSTLEMVNACRTIPDEARGPIPDLWSRGFTMGLMTTPEGEVDNTIIAGVMMRLVQLVGAWHLNVPGTPHAQAIADLCLAAAHAARADGLADSSIDIQAEYIALHGTDTTDAHHEAIRIAESAVITLKHLDII